MSTLSIATAAEVFDLLRDDLAAIERAVGAQPVLTTETAALFRAVAQRWAGSFVDVARLGIPSRHLQRGRQCRLLPPSRKSHYRC